MKSRTSFFDKTAFRKDVTRFAPAWGLYSVGLALVLMTVWLNGSEPYHNARTIANLLPLTAAANFCYGLINAQLLFADLFNPRLCNALHAMPLKRETWFGSHVAAGLAFSVIPNLGAVAFAYLILKFQLAWPVMLWWLLAATLQYVCFFGIGLFCMMLSGNRLAAGITYGIVNFLSLLIFWLLDSLYEPLLGGIRFYTAPFEYFCPVVCMADDMELVEILGQRVLDSNGDFLHWNIEGIRLDTGSWLMLAGYALVGLILAGAALVMYKKRNLECAGDFAAFKFAEPVLLVTYSLAVGVFAHLFGEAAGLDIARYLFLVVGITVGFFTGLMLLNRTTRVFKIRNALAFGAFAGVFLMSLVLTWLDPLGVTRWVPTENEVESVYLTSRYAHEGYSEGELTLTQEQQILDMIAIHSDAITQNEGELFVEPGYMTDVQLCLEYTLKNGSVRTRFYEIDAKSPMGQLLKKYYSSFEYVTGYREEQIPELAKNIVQINTNSTEPKGGTEDYLKFIQDVDREELLRCIAADCAEGNMAQFSAYHLKLDEDGNRDWGDRTYLEFGIAQLAPNMEVTVESGPGDMMPTFYTYLNIYDECAHTLNWMIENGLYDPEKPLG